MIALLRVLKGEYLGKEKATMDLFKDAPRLPSAHATDRIFTDNRGDFSLDGHRLSSLYRKSETAFSVLTNRYFSAFSLQKYSPGVRGWKTPAALDQTKAQHQ